MQREGRACGKQVRRQKVVDNAELTQMEDFFGKSLPQPPSAYACCGVRKEAGESSRDEGARTDRGRQRGTHLHRRFCQIVSPMTTTYYRILRRRKSRERDREYTRTEPDPRRQKTRQLLCRYLTTEKYVAKPLPRTTPSQSLLSRE